MKSTRKPLTVRTSSTSSLLLKKTKARGFPLAFCLVALSLLSAPWPVHAAQYPLRRSLSSFTGGSFYVTRPLSDGAVEVSPCQPFSGKNLKAFRHPYFCTPDRGGFRCSSDRTPEVIFVFGSRRACTADRNATLEKEE